MHSISAELPSSLVSDTTGLSSATTLLLAYISCTGFACLPVNQIQVAAWTSASLHLMSAGLWPLHTPHCAHPAYQSSLYHGITLGYWVRRQDIHCWSYCLEQFACSFVKPFIICLVLHNPATAIETVCRLQMVNHDILIQCLQVSFGIVDTIHHWFLTYICLVNLINT